MKIKLDKISIDGGTQPRKNINEDIVSEYTEAMQDGDNFPPVIVFNDGAKYWLADGFHRYHASKKVGYLEIEAEVKNGTKRDAILYSVSANAKHGLRRTNADKRKAVKTLLQDEEWSQWSDREIARRCEVTHPFVSKMRSNLTGNDYQSKRKGADGRTIDTSNIGNKEIKQNTTKENDIDIDPETGEIPDEDFEYNNDTLEKQTNRKERKGIGLEKAHQAISKLKEIPPNDGLKQDAYDTVVWWINDNR